MKYLLTIALALLWAIPAQGDTIHVDASATWGNAWFNGEFDWDTNTNSFLAESISATSSLGSITSFYVQPKLADFFTADGYMFQVYCFLYPIFHNGQSLFGVPGEYTFSSGAYDGFFLFQPNVSGWVKTGNNRLSVTPVVTPEPAMLSMLLAGLVGIGVMRSAARRHP